MLNKRNIIMAGRGLCCAFLFMSAMIQVQAAETNKPPAFVLPSEVTHPISTFDDKSSAVRDPFFPHSNRAPYVKQVAKETGKVAPAPVLQFALKAIMGTGKNKMALINNQTLAEGESATVKSGTSTARVHCVKIADRSVMITVDGKNEQIELRMQDK